MRFSYLFAAVTVALLVHHSEQQFVQNNNGFSVNNQFQNAEKVSDPNAVRASTTTTTPVPSTTSSSIFSRVKNFFSRSDGSTTAAPVTGTTRPTTTSRPSVQTSTVTQAPRVSSSANTPATVSSTRVTPPSSTAWASPPTQAPSSPRVAASSQSTTTAAPSTHSFASIVRGGGAGGAVQMPINGPGSSSVRPPSPTPANSRVSFIPQSTYSPVYPRPSIQGSAAVKTQEDRELVAFTEELFQKEDSPNNLVEFHFQGRTQSFETRDDAPESLISIQKQKLSQHPTISKLIALLNNYELDVSVNEYDSPAEKIEQNEFIDAISRTAVMQHTKSFLQSKGKLSPDVESLKKLLKEIWFTLYSRGAGKIGSSSFEHIFLAEVRNSSIIGLHNWVYFAEMETAKVIDYKGYLKKFEFGNKGGIAKVRFSYNNINKPVNTMFVGTSPELEIALYTVCFVLRPEKDCPISLNGKTANIRTYTFRYRGKELIGSAYPEI